MQAFDLACGGPHALRIGLDLDRQAGGGGDHGGQVADGDLAATARMDSQTLDPRQGRGPEEGIDGIVDEDEVARRPGVAQADRSSGQQLDRDRGDDRARALARAEGVERPQGHDRRPERAMVALGQLVGRDLGGGVGRLANQRVGLRHRDELG